MISQVNGVFGKRSAHLVAVLILIKAVQKELAAEYFWRAESATDSRAHTLMLCRGFAATV